jgi:pilus assembly protein Flp/PilA
VKDFAADASGATAIEYALIASVISVVIVTAIGSVGDKVLGLFENLVSRMN